ncbi:MAG: hypothetical protein EOO14_05715, partial [Chitinophagaceae bacterium]
MTNGIAYARVLLFFVTSGLVSCGLCSKKVACPGYKDELLDSWFPYTDGQQLRFRGNANNMETYTLVNTETMAPYEASSSGYGSTPRCVAQKVFQSAEKDSLGGSKAAIYLQSTEDHRQTSFSFGRNHFSISLVGENSTMVSTGSRNMIIVQQPAVIVGTRTFTNLLEATGDTSQTKNAGVYKVYFARGKG